MLTRVPVTENAGEEQPGAGNSINFVISVVLRPN